MLDSETVKGLGEGRDSRKRDDAKTDVLKEILAVNLLFQQLLEIFFHFFVFPVTLPLRILTAYEGVKLFMLYEIKPKPSTLACGCRTGGRALLARCERSTDLATAWGRLGTPTVRERTLAKPSIELDGRLVCGVG